MDADRRYVMRCGAAYIGRELARVDEACLVIADGRVQAAGTRDEVAIPPESILIDASSKTVLPGFIDAHVHIGLAEPRAVLERGVTCVRDLAWPRDEIFPLAERSRGSQFEGPLILPVGPMLTVEGGYPITAAWAPTGTGLPLSSPEDAERAVAGLVAQGARAIKIALNPPAGRVLGDDLLTAVVAEAHRLGTIVTAHIHGLDQLHRALDAGVDELAHVLMSRERIPDETLDRMGASGTVIVPTLSIFPDANAPTAIENLGRFLAAGGTVVYGTDLGNEGPSPGIDRREVVRMGRAGMSLLDIVRSATTDAGDWLRLDRKGFIGPGMDADIIAIDGSLRPTDSPERLTEVSVVMREGRLVRS